MKNFKRVLSVVLALLMCMSMISLAAFAADEEEKSDALFELDFEGIEAGKDLKDYPEYVGNAGFLQPHNKVMEETKADGSTNKFWRLPFAGHCIVTSGGSRPADLDGNADKSLYAKHDQFDYTMGESLVIETAYRWDAKDVAPRLECQFANITGYKRQADGSYSEASSTGSWISLYNINGSTLALGNCGTLTGAGELIPGEWNTVRLIINLAEGRYDVYVNGVLYATDAYISQSGGAVNQDWGKITVPANKLVIAKMNKMLNTYSAQTVYDDWDVYFDVDDVKMYFTDDLIDVNVNGRDMKVFPGQELTFKKTNSPFVYAEITDDKDVKTINTTGKFTVDKAGYTIEATYGTRGALGYEGYELLADAEWKAKAAEIYGATSLIGVANAWEIVEEIDEETVTAINSLKVKLSDAVNGKGITMRHAAVDAVKYPVVNLFSTITPAAGAGVDVKLKDEVLYTVKGNEIAGLTKAEGAPEIKAGELVDMKTVINLQKGKVSVYVLAEVLPEAPAPETPAPAAEGDAAGEPAPVEPVYEYVLYGTKDIAKAEITENALSYVINKDNAFVADSTLILGAFALEDGDKVRVKLVWDRYSEVQYNKDGTPQVDKDGNPVLKWFEQSSNDWYHLGTTYDLTRAARSFQSANITYALAAGQEVAEQEVINVPALEITEKLSGASVELVYSLAIFSTTFDNVVTNETTGVIMAGGDLNTASHVYSAIREENGNKYAHIPYQGTSNSTGGGSAGSGNFDRAIKPAHPEISYEKTDVVVVEMDYRLHFVDLEKGTGADATKVYCGYEYTVNKQDPTSEVQFNWINSFKNAGDTEQTKTNWANLFQINVKTGAIKILSGEKYAEGKQNIAQDTWTKIKMVFSLKDGSFSVYTNDVLYGTGACSVSGTNYTILANSLFVGKCNKNGGAYKTLNTPEQIKDLKETVTTAVDNSENITYVDVDNVTFRYIEDRQISIDGTGKKVQETDIVDLTVEGQQLLFSTITLDGKTTVTTATEVVPVNGMKIERYTISKFKTINEEMLRVGQPTGVRFVTVVNPEFTELLFNELGLTIKFGTIIAPADAVKAAKEFTKEALTAEDGTAKYAEVLAFAGKTFYDRSIKDEIGANYAYAGSIANIKEANLTTKFMGRGFIEVYEGEGENMKLVASMYSEIDAEETGACISDLAWEYLDSKGSTLGEKFFNYLNSYVVEE